MSKANFISCVCWVKKGIAKEIPDKIDLSKDELKRIIDDTKQDNQDNMEVSDSDEDSNENENENEDDSDGDNNDENVIKRYNLENYDNDDGDENAALSLANIAMFASNEDDPYLANDSDDSEENENFKIKKEDNLILVGHIEKDCSLLEVYVYNHENDDLYVHHDIFLPAYPLCLEWLNYDLNHDDSQSANYVAIGDMTKDICIWDLDLVNSLEPVSKLVGHKDSVLDLSWNKLLPKTIASGSADESVILWDLDSYQLASNFDKFKSRIQSLEFHPYEVQTLLIGDANSTISIADCQSGGMKKWTIENSSEVEKVVWNPYNPYYCYASSSDGFVYCLDCRNDKKFVYTIKAHNDAVTGLCFSYFCPGSLITSSSDKTIKVWNVDENQAKFVYEYSNLNMGSILGIDSNPDTPLVIAVGGDNKSNNFKVLDLTTSKQVQTHFTSSLNMN